MAIEERFIFFGSLTEAVLRHQLYAVLFALETTLAKPYYRARLPIGGRS
jgi:hypothetical protein